MTVIIMIAQLILGLSILVFLHELGHFLTARAFGIRVEKFYIFFDAWGKKLFSFQWGDTEYGIGWLPLGGYVKIAGMVDESLDTKQLATEPEAWEFRSKPAWQRLIVMLGGVTVNAILGVIIFSGMLMYWGEKYIPNDALKHGIAASDIAEEIGLRDGDKLVAINGNKIERFDEIISSEVLLGNDVVIQVSRNGELTDIAVPANFTSRLLEADKSLFVQPRMQFTVGEVSKGMPAAEAGLLEGDQIYAVNGMGIAYFDQLQASLLANKAKPVQLGVIRGSDSLVLQATVTDAGTIGFFPQLEELPLGYKQFSFAESVPAGATMAWKVISDNVKGFGKIFSGDIPVQKSLGGPIAIAKKMYGGEWDWYRFWMTTGLLSMILAFMNLLPIPALDGGHVVFLLIEMVIRRPLPEKVLLVAQYAGMVILISLMVFAFGNDIWQHILK
jgi:regulator of sigma E protease